MILFIIIWYLVGLLCTWIWYNSLLKEWYCRFNESYWDFDKRNGHTSGIRLLAFTSPLISILGPFLLILAFVGSDIKYITLYFKVPKK